MLHVGPKGEYKSGLNLESVAAFELFATKRHERLNRYTIYELNDAFVQENYISKAVILSPFYLPRLLLYQVYKTLVHEHNYIGCASNLHISYQRIETPLVLCQ